MYVGGVKRWFWIAWVCLSAGACQPEAAGLGLSAVAPPQVLVAHEAVVPLLADVPAGQAVTFGWETPDRKDLAERARRPTLSAYSGGRALWRFTPLATDVGALDVVFWAESLGQRGQVALSLFVEAGAEPPKFREPVGEGTTLDLKRAACAEVAVVVESSSSPQVSLSLVEPVRHAEVVQDEALSGTLRFCPSAEQIAQGTVYPLLLQAEAAKQSVRKSYVIVLRRPG